MSKVTGISEVQNNITRWANRSKLMASFASQATATQVQNEAQDRRKWTDRTSTARRSIKGTWEFQGGTRFTVALAIGVYYGVFLENKYAGRLAIVGPTTNENRHLLEENYARLARV